MARVQIFLSTVTDEFGEYRKRLRHDLTRPNVSVAVQEDFIVTGTETLDMLDDYIRQCDAVIHLVGDMTGALAKAPSLTVIRERYPDMGEKLPPVAPFLQPGAPALSYTQWEAWLALYHRKPLIIATPEENAPRDERYKWIPEQYAAQQAHVKRLAEMERYPFRFGNADRLVVEVLRSKLQEILAQAVSPADGRISLGAGPSNTWSWPKPWDFSGYINDKRHNFIGRTWLFDEVETWRKSATQALLIVADYGVGKSAFVAELVCRNPQNAVVAHHFCHHDTAETINPATLVRSLAAQLAATLPEYKSTVEQDAAMREWIDKADADPGSAIERAIVAPLNHVAKPATDALYIVVDALDESLEFDAGKRRTSRQHIASLLAAHASRLPGWLKILATSRRRQEILQPFQQSFRTQTLDAEDACNLEDIHAYVINRCGRAPLADKLARTDTSPEGVASILANPERSRGKFLYVVRVLNDVASGSLDITRLADLPLGMDGFYVDAFNRRFGTVEYETVRPVLAALAVAREPMGRSDLAAILGKPEPQVQTALATLEDFLSIRTKRYAFDHYSLAQWLTEENDQGFPRAGRFAVSLTDGQQRFRDWALKQVGENRAHESMYLARHLSEHLAREDRANVYRKLLFDFHWLRVKLCEASINALLTDCSEAPEEPEISALGQALRQAAHIVGREGPEWSGSDQLASQLCARLLHRAEPQIRRLLTNARTAQSKRPWLYPLTASLQASSFLLRTLDDPSFGGDALAALSDGRLASGSYDNTIKLWDLATGRCTATLEGHSSSVHALVLLPDGRLASGSSDKTIKLWDVGSGHCTTTLEGHSSSVYALVLLPDGRLASGSDDKTIKLWDMASGHCTATLEGHRDFVRALVPLPDGRLVSGALDWTIKLWDVARSRCTATLEGCGFTAHPLPMLPDGRIAFGSYDNTIKLWDMASGHCTATLEGHSNAVHALALLPDGRLVSGALDRTIKLWDVATGHCIATLEGHGDFVSALVPLPDGRLVSGALDRTIKLWDMGSGHCTTTLEGHSSSVYALVLLPDGRLASGSDDNTIKLWDMASGHCTATLEGHSNGVHALVLLPDGRLASGSDDKTIKLWDMASGHCTATLEGHRDFVRALVPLPDGRLAFGTGDNKTVAFWDVTSGHCTATHEGYEGCYVHLNALAVLPDGRLASAGQNAEINLWDLASGNCNAILDGHDSCVWALAVLPDGRLASGSDDKTIKLWDLASRYTTTLKGHSDGVIALALLPDGQLASGSVDKTIRIWSWSSKHQNWTSSVAFVADTSISALCYFPAQRILVAGDAAGRVHFLKWEGPDKHI